MSAMCLHGAAQATLTPRPASIGHRWQAPHRVLGTFETMSDEIVVVAIAEAKPTSAAEVERVIRTCVGATRAEAGCISYVAHADTNAPARFVFVEHWASRAALATHEKQPHFVAMAKAFEGLLAGPLQVLVLRELA